MQYPHDELYRRRRALVILAMGVTLLVMSSVGWTMRQGVHTAAQPKRPKRVRVPMPPQPKDLLEPVALNRQKLVFPERLITLPNQDQRHRSGIDADRATVVEMNDSAVSEDDALTRTAPPVLAPRGEPGLYSLHVMSYAREVEAYRFARALRAQGHRAFVQEAHEPQRPVMWRVRIGPFGSRREARSYSETFEASQHLYARVVRRRAGRN